MRQNEYLWSKGLIKGWSNTNFYFQKDIIPPGIHAASRVLGIAMEYFQNACFIYCLQNEMSNTHLQNFLKTRNSFSSKFE